MYDTRNDLSLTIRTEAVKLLNARLADAIDLGTRTKYTHWNLRGPNFIALHELFDKLAEWPYPLNTAGGLGQVAAPDTSLTGARPVRAPHDYRG